MPRRKLVGLLVLTVVSAVLLSPRFQALSAFPAQLRVLVGSNEEFDLDVPLNLYARCDREGVLGLNGQSLGNSGQKVSLSSPLVFEPLEPGRTEIEFSLFGWIPFKRVVVDVLPEVDLVPGGHSIGVLLQPDGVLVVGLATVTDPSGTVHSPARVAGLEVGDIIVRVAGTPVSSDDQIAQIVDNAARTGQPVAVEVRRHGANLKVSVQAVLSRDDARYRLGILVRDMTAGVGTLSFWDPETMIYGALGHVISDAESGQPVDVHTGRIVQAFVSQVQPGRKGEPGEKLGTFIEGRNVLGTITKNSAFGIYGHLDRKPPGGLYDQAIPMALASQVRTGPAELLTVLDGDKMERFAVNIRRVYSQSRAAAKGMILEVTDKGLLERTGGIVQGMSGSPIIQNGKLVGAVTHVFVNDPTRGYGIFAEWMLFEAGLGRGGATGVLPVPAGLRAALAPLQ